MSVEKQLDQLEKKVRALRERYTVECPHCGRPILASYFASAAARRAVSMRKTHAPGPGRPKKLKHCPKCGELLGVSEMRKHHC